MQKVLRCCEGRRYEEEEGVQSGDQDEQRMKVAARRSAKACIEQDGVSRSL